MAGMIERGNVMDPELAIFFLSELDGMIQSDIMLHGPEEIVRYKDQEQELLLRKPHDGVYVHFLVAMIRQVQEEFEGYNNAQGIVNEKLETFREWYVAHYDPAETASREYMGAAPGGAGYGFAYLTAYGLAVKHGYQGTEEEWLRSLEGQPGAAGAAARMRFDAGTGMIQWGVGDAWYDLFTLEELRDPAVDAMMAEVRELTDRAGREAEVANQAANNAAGYATAAGGHARTAADAAADALGFAGQAYASEQAAVTAAGDAQVQAETAEGYAAKAEASAAEARGAAEGSVGAVAQHDISARAHNDIRLELQALRGYVTTLLDSDDTTLDQLSEIVAYIKSNRTLLDAVATGKVNVADIVNDLVTNVAGRPLSAAMGVELAARIAELKAVITVTAADAGKLAMVRADGSLGPVAVGDGLEVEGGRLNVVGGGAVEDPDDPDGVTGGYYTPTVSQGAAGTMTVHYEPSSPELPAVPDVTVALPEGPQGPAYELTNNDIKDIVNEVLDVLPEGGDGSGGTGGGTSKMQELFRLTTTEEVGKIETGIDLTQYAEIVAYCDTIPVDGTSANGHFDWYVSRRVGLRINNSLHSTQRRIHMAHITRLDENKMHAIIAYGSGGDIFATGLNESSANNLLSFMNFNGGFIIDNVNTNFAFGSYNAGTMLKIGTRVVVYGRRL